MEAAVEADRARGCGVHEQGMGTCERHHEGGVRWGELVRGGYIMCTGAIRLRDTAYASSSSRTAPTDCISPRHQRASRRGER